MVDTMIHRNDVLKHAVGSKKTEKKNIFLKWNNCMKKGSISNYLALACSWFFSCLNVSRMFHIAYSLVLYGSHLN